MPTPTCLKIPAMLHLLSFEKVDGKLTEQSRHNLAQQFNALGDGSHELTIKPKSTAYRGTRYKYYFGHVLPVILGTVGKSFEVLDGDTFRPVRDTSEIHDTLKMKYNPIIIKTPFGAFTVPSSTTGLSDTEFINRFEEQVIAEFSGPPFHCEFMTRPEYGQFMASHHR